MIRSPKEKILKEFQTIPGVGKSISEDFWDLGFRSVSEIKGKDPQRLYEDLCNLKSTNLDRCLLYVFRCAVYYTSHRKHDPELLKWWNWKDKK